MNKNKPKRYTVTVREYLLRGTLIGTTAVTQEYGQYREALDIALSLATDPKLAVTLQDMVSGNTYKIHSDGSITTI